MGKPWEGAELESLEIREVDTWQRFTLQNPDTERTPEAWQRARQRRGLKGYVNGAPEATSTATADDLLALLRKRQGGIDLDGIWSELGIQPDVANKLIRELRDRHIDVQELTASYYGAPTIYTVPKMAAPPTLTEPRLPYDADVIRFGVMADSHMNSVHCKEEALFGLYDRFEAEGVPYVLHGGDITTAERVFRGQEYEVERVGFDAQLDYTAEHYPRRRGIKTIAIGGNHDFQYQKMMGANFPAALAARREDIDFIGWYDATVWLGDLKVRLWHGAGGGAYALSYTAQKFIRDMPGGSKPDILIVGHFHNMIQFVSRDVYVIHPGCTEGQSLWAKRKGLNAQIGGFLVEATMEPTDRRPGREKTVRSIRTEWIGYYLDSEGRVC